jgi:ferredoxin-NADP reductase
MAYNFFPGRLVEVKDASPNVKRFFIEMTDRKRFDFTPGQFVMLDLPIDSKRTTRSYSIASHPNGSNIFELVIVLKEDGAGTPFLFEDAEIGKELKVSKPLGKFTLPEDLPKDIEICFICTGTGVAPFRSMIQDMEENGGIKHKINLIFGCRHKENILYREEFEKLESEYENFHYHPVLSRENEETWDGCCGYVHQVYQKLYEDKRPALFYICGWREMIIEARDNLKEMGYDKKQIKFELYD